MSETIPFLLEGLWTTLVITVVSFLIGAVLGIPVALARISRTRVLRWSATVFVEVVRGVPVIAWMLVLFYGVSRYLPLDPLLAACVALGTVSTAYLAENYRAGISSVSTHQWEGAQAVGLGGRDTFWRIIAPQGVGVALPPSAGYAVGLIKDSATASVIGVSDLTFKALTLNQQGNPGLPIFATAGLIYLLLSLPIALGARKLDTFVRIRSEV